MFKFFILIFITLSLFASTKNPSIYSTMGDPLYNCVDKLERVRYTELAKETKNYGYKLENKEYGYNTSDYLKKLRSLQKEYDYNLHVVHENINKAIDKKNYEEFLKLTSCKLDGLLKHRALLDKSLIYYKKNKKKKKSKFFEKKIQDIDNLYVEPKEYYIVISKTTSSLLRASIMKSIGAKHDDSYVYALPYLKGTSHVVSQGYNGKYTHKGTSQYAIDFAMKIGTKICAARDGKIIATKYNSNKGGKTRAFSKYGNFIMIQHSDNTLATYYHLKQNGVAVKVGQKVVRGEVIGYSGNTGYSTGPHLHFAVFKALSVSKRKTIATRFKTANALMIKPKNGKYYKAN